MPPDAQQGHSLVDTLAEDSVAAERSKQDAVYRPAPKLERGAQLGRYHVLDRIGVGGMGIVYTAYDPELDRAVALKLLHPGTHGDQETTGQQRLLREARAMARLTAPNVVTVHDIGEVDDHIYIAMEYVDGETLTRWLQTRRGWREVVDVLTQAGRGLAAAHDAGIVHRDFKPDNVMLARDGRVLVMDFGIARDVAAPSQDGVEVSSATSGSRSGDLAAESLTEVGAVMGTAAYMAPEQHLGLVADARADQFAFCVVLYEALYGERPFAGDTMAALAVEVSEGNVREPPKGSGVPAWLRRIVLRGLSPTPADRFPDIGEVLSALGRDPAAVWRRRFVGGGVLTAVAAAGYGAWAANDEDPCAMVGEPVAAVWSDATRDAARAAFEGTALVYAADTFSRVETRLDAYASAWSTARVDACTATMVQHRQSSDLMDRRMVCLDVALGSMEGLVGVLVDADKPVVTQAVSAVEELPDLDRCADAERLLAALPPPEDPEVRTRVGEIRVGFARAMAIRDAGRFDEAAAAYEELAVAAADLEYPPLEAEILLHRAEAVGRARDREEAAALLHRAFAVARAARHDEAALDAALQLADLARQDKDRLGEAAVWLEVAEADLERAGAPEQRVRAVEGRASILSEQGRHKEAAEVHAESLALLAADDNAQSSWAAIILNNRAVELYESGRIAASVREYADALALMKAIRGDRHPHVAAMLGNLGRAERLSGDLDAAYEHQREALELKEILLGPTHPSTAYALDALGLTLIDRRDVYEAIRLLKRACAIRDEVLGRDDPLAAATRAHLGRAYDLAGRIDDAQAAHSEALTVFRQAGDPADVSEALSDLAALALKAGKVEQAAKQSSEAITLLDEDPNVEAAARAAPLLVQARVQLERGRAEAAVEAATAAEAALTAASAAPHRVAEARIVLAEARWAAGITEPDPGTTFRTALETLSRTPGRQAEAEALSTRLQHRMASVDGP